MCGPFRRGGREGGGEDILFPLQAKMTDCTHFLLRRVNVCVCVFFRYVFVSKKSPQNRVKIVCEREREREKWEGYTPRAPSY